MQDRWYKNNNNDKIWWLDNCDKIIGAFIFSFDRKKRYNLFSDYPKNMTKKEIDIFNSENPYWKSLLKERL